MNPNEKGWLKEYIDFRTEMLRELTTDAARKRSHPEHSLYRIIQPTGLMYGQSISVSGHPDQETSVQGRHRAQGEPLVVAQRPVGGSLAR